MKAMKLLAVLMAVVTLSVTAVSSARAVAPEGTAGADAMAQRYVFVVNRLGARPAALANIRHALATFSREALGASDEVMIVDIGYSSRVLLEFGASREELLETIDGLPLMPVNVLQRRATRQLYETLDEIAGRLGEFPGRKAIILASGEPNRIRSGIHYVRDTVEKLNRANATVFSIDLDVFRLPFRRGVVRSGLSGLASDTGGRYFFTQSRTGFLPSLLQVADALRIDAVAVADR